jgi:hypothetical protein
LVEFTVYRLFDIADIVRGTASREPCMWLCVLTKDRVCPAFAVGQRSIWLAFKLMAEKSLKPTGAVIDASR